MTEQAVEKGLNRLKSKRSYLESVTWRPEDTQDAMEFYDFQDYVASLVEMWESVCRLRDFAEEHDIVCDNDHRNIFDTIDQTIISIHKFGSEIIRDILPRFEEKFGPVKLATELKVAVEQARILSTEFDEDTLAQTRTSISNWK